MKIKDMFERDIDRQINGVIKVNQEDQANIEQELSEYVVTDELRRHFKAFYDRYDRALDEPTDKIGIWVSGFFGSGKSHFLKMLSYLLTNRRLGNKCALDYIGPRFEDPDIEANARRAASVTTDAILFNIDSKDAQGSTSTDKSAIARVFAKMYYESRGFYGSDLRLARLERYIDDKGKTEEFRAAYEQAGGQPWVKVRSDYFFNDDILIEALASCGIMSEAEATRWCERDDDEEFSIDQLTSEIAAYAERRERACGGKYRMLFMIDEMGQFIADDSRYMLNLQTVVEDLGSKCGGRVWVIVTGQQAIDEITQVKGGDFSKIQGRFNTRLSLSSSCADEVIRRRILSKNEDAANLLRAQYAESHVVLSNLFSFTDAAADLIGYTDVDDFIATYPFADYQFTLMQRIMDELRNHGASGKHSSSAERSMLNGFQDAACRIEDADQTALAPLYLFYDTISTFLEDYHRRVINRADEAARHGQGLEPYDVDVLKLLFLIMYVDRDMPANIDNIVTLMTDSVHMDRIAARERVQAALDRLVRQNYVARTGDVYKYLTDDEREVAEQIQRTQPEMAKLVKKASEIFFGEVFENAKLTVGKNVFEIEEYLDDTRVNNASGLTLRVITGIDGNPTPSHEELCSRSGRIGSADGEVIVVLDPKYDYYQCLYESCRIEQFANKARTEGSLTESRDSILRSKQQERRNLEGRALDLMRQAVVHGKFYVQGSASTPAQSSSAKNMLEDSLRELAKSVYTKLSLIDKNYDDDAQIKQILTAYTPAAEGFEPNAAALENMASYLSRNHELHLPVSMADILEHYHAKPFGWNERDIAAVTATLLVQKRARMFHAGQPVDLNDSKLMDYLRKASKAGQVTVEARQSLSDKTKKDARDAVNDLTGNNTLPVEEESLAEECRRELSDCRVRLAGYLDVQYRRNSKYPGYNEVAEIKTAIDNILDNSRDAADLLTAIAQHKRDFEGYAEDLEDIDGFFAGQVQIFDRANSLARKFRGEHENFEGDTAVEAALDKVDAALEHPSLNLRYQELSEANALLAEAYDSTLAQRRTAMLDEVEQRFDAIEDYAASRGVDLAQIGERRASRRDGVHDAETLTDVDAIATKLTRDEQSLYKQVDQAFAEKNRPKPTNIHVTLTSDHSVAANARVAAAARPMATISEPPSAPAPQQSVPRVKLVNRNLVFKPLQLSSVEEVDAYLSAARERLVAYLQDNDSIRLS